MAHACTLCVLILCAFDRRSLAVVFQHDDAGASSEASDTEVGKHSVELCLQGTAPPPSCGTFIDRSCLQAGFRPWSGVTYDRFDRCLTCCLEAWAGALQKRGNARMMGLAQNNGTDVEHGTFDSVRAFEMMLFSNGFDADTDLWHTRARELSDVYIRQHIETPMSKTLRTRLGRLPPGALIWWERDSNRDAFYDLTFFEEIVPALKNPVSIAVFGDPSEPLSGTCQSANATMRPMDLDGDPRIRCPEPDFLPYLEHPNVLAFLSYNPSVVHPKVVGYSIGVGPKVSITVKALRESLQPGRAEGRETLLFCDGLTTASDLEHPWRVAHRRGVQEKLISNGFNCSSARIDLQDWLREAMGAKFVAAPRGMGRAVHRVWEALLAGAVPIVERDPILREDVYKGLPMVEVASWSEVTPGFLEREWVRVQQEARAGAYDQAMGKLYWPYWFDRFTHALSPELQSARR